MSKLIAITGNTGTGKTTFVKRLAKRFKRVVAFDINDEYKDVAVCFYDTEQLLDYITLRKNLLVIIDEATAFFHYRSYNNELNKLLQLRRHNQHLFIFVYHSINFIPKYLRMYLNYIVVFKQNTDFQEINGVKIEIPKKNFKFNVYKIN
jgi:energy-coupling factor transporter ATP-binding protein EcfA2